MNDANNGISSKSAPESPKEKDGKDGGRDGRDGKQDASQLSSKDKEKAAASAADAKVGLHPALSPLLRKCDHSGWMYQELKMEEAKESKAFSLAVSSPKAADVSAVLRSIPAACSLCRPWLDCGLLTVRVCGPYVAVLYVRVVCGVSSRAQKRRIAQGGEPRSFATIHGGGVVPGAPGEVDVQVVQDSQRRFAAWIGGSMFASLETFPTVRVSAEEQAQVRCSLP